MIRCSRINEQLITIRRRICIKGNTRIGRCMPMRKLLEKKLRLMLCFLTTASSFLKHLDSTWTSHPQKLQCHFVFFTFDLVPLSLLSVGTYWEGFGPLFCLLLQECCFFRLLDFSFCCATKDLLDIPAVLITPRRKILSCSLIKKSQKTSRLGFV